MIWLNQATKQHVRKTNTPPAFDQNHYFSTASNTPAETDEAYEGTMNCDNHVCPTLIKYS